MKKLVLQEVIYAILTFASIGLLLLYLFTDLVNWYGWLGWLWTVFISLMLQVQAKKKALRSLIKFCWVAASQDEVMDVKESAYIQLLAKHFSLTESDLLKFKKELENGKEIEIPENIEDKKKILECVAGIIKIDEKITANEREFLFNTAEKLGLSKSDAEALL